MKEWAGGIRVTTGKNILGLVLGVTGKYILFEFFNILLW
jgi:hypothetical protein